MSTTVRRTQASPTEEESLRRLEKVIEDLRALSGQTRKLGRRSRIVVVVEVDEAGAITENSHIEPPWLYPCRE